MAHGTDPNTLDEETFRQICVMYTDGLIGNRMVIETLGNLTAGVYNYLRAEGSAPYKLKDIIRTAHDYFYPQQNTTVKPSDSLLSYISQAKGFGLEKFKGAK